MDHLDYQGDVHDGAVLLLTVVIYTMEGG